MNKRIFCISGLGADQRIFGKLSIPGYELLPVPWVPYDRDDTLPSYARKMFKSINDEHAIIIGVSFGGMLATEIAKQHPGCDVYVVSGATKSAELSMPHSGILPFIIRVGLLPAWLLTMPNPVLLHYFGAATQDDKRLLRGIIKDSDGKFMKWALKAMLLWRNATCPANVIHIHGTADKIIRSALVHPHHWIQHGEHIMVYNRAAEVSKIISHHLADEVALQ